MALDPADIATVSRLLDAVLELAPAEREGWLGALPADQQRHAATLRAMLARQVHLDTVNPLGSMPDLRVDEAVAHADDVVGPYRLLREIGRGGMGSVWLAERADGSFKRRVALKLPRLAWGAGLAERMAREREIGAMLEHPNIARLYEAGVDERGRPYLALEYIDGQPIDAWCEAQNLSVRDRLRLLLQVANAVSYAHGRLVVHRDLKPSNVMVTPDGQAHLLDFGIAKLLRDAARGEPGLTQEQGRVLTPHYASPEQVAGEAITVQSDVYSLGVLLYELLTGTLPIAPKRSTLGAVEEAILEGNVPLASSRVKGRVRARALRGELDAILAMAMKRDPAKRYATVDAFADDLQRHLDGHTVSARPDSLAYRVSRFVGRHKLGVGLATVALTTIIASAAVAEFQRRDAERERDVATRQRVNAEAVAAFMGEQLGQTDEPGLPIDPASRIDRAQIRANQLFFDVPDVLIQLHGAFYGLNSMLSRHDAKLGNVEAINAAAARLDDPIARATASCMGTAEGMTASAALTQIDRAIAGLPATEGSRNARSICLYERSSQLVEAGRYDEAARDLDAAHDLTPVLLRRMTALDYLRGKGELLSLLGKPHAADQARAEVIELVRADGRGRSIRMVQDLRARAFYHGLMGRPREGLVFAEQAAELAKSSGNGATFVPYVTLTTARLLFDLDRPNDARRMLESVLLREGRLVPIFSRGWDVVALAYRLRGEHAAAVAVLEQDLAANRETRYSLWDSLSRVSLADEMLAKGDPDRALATLDMLDREPGAQPYRWESIWLRARAHNKAGQYAKAEAAARAAVAEAARRAPPDRRSSLHGHAFLELARTLAALGRADEARAAAARAAVEFTDSLGPEHSATRAATALAQR